MTDHKEVLAPNGAGVETEPMLSDEENGAGLYERVLLGEATNLLGEYLPEALPQEPTEIFVGVVPQYIGKFKGKHCIALERDPQLDPIVQAMTKYLQALQRFEEQDRLLDELESERFRLIKAKVNKGEYDFEEIDERIDREEEAVIQMPRPEPKKAEPKDWQEPEKLLQGTNQYSIDSWRGVYMLVHELIHQRQAELNPSAFPVLTSPELDSIDPDSVNRSELYDLLLKAHKAHTGTQQPKDSLFDPVIEGMAVLGSFYVMGRFVKDLTASGEIDMADKVRRVRKTAINHEMVEPKRKERAGEDNIHNLIYAEGMGVMRKLYKQFGIENIPRILASVDLSACRQIAKNSPQYKQMMENPALLPGLQQAA